MELHTEHLTLKPLSDGDRADLMDLYQFLIKSFQAFY